MGRKKQSPAVIFSPSSFHARCRPQSKLSVLGSGAVDEARRRAGFRPGMGWPSILPLCSPSLSPKLNLLVQKLLAVLKKKKVVTPGLAITQLKNTSPPPPAPVDAALVVALQTKLYKCCSGAAVGAAPVPGVRTEILAMGAEVGTAGVSGSRPPSGVGAAPPGASS